MAAPLEGVFVPQPPNPNVAPAAYSAQYLNQANNQLKLYLSLLASNQFEIVKFINSPSLLFFYYHHPIYIYF